ncbi:MAG: 23S rRNA (uracil(1939)-C(5))-methyltransferase RlmD [Ruminococcaceae bacterium]|nr:23S rRNA (uracil(1939)-C(5))-methyltransferase RlmD [Oscillospiraceae bacterium]
MYYKNDILQLNIIDMSLEGKGIAKTEDGYTLFVDGGVVGDEVKAIITKTNKTYGFAKVTEIIKESSFRVEPECNVCDVCGGCTLSEISYEKQLEIKSNIVKNNLSKIGGLDQNDYTLEEIIPSPMIEGYRNKAQYPVAFKGGRAIAGFFERKSHNVTECKSCVIQSDKINKVINLCVKFLNEFKVSIYNEKSHKGIVRSIYVREGYESLMVCIVTNSEKPLKNTDKLIEMLKEENVTSIIQNINTKKTNVVLGDRNIVLWGEEYIREKIGELIFEVSPLSFYQVNSSQVQNLYDKAKEYADISDENTVFDLYCGVGTIGLYMADKAKKLIGVEIVKDARDNAERNAKNNGIANAEFYAGDCGKVVRELVNKGEKADIVIVDPPRKGCSEEVIELLSEINPKKIVYISCNSATLARDVASLKEKGYRMDKCTPVDMFPETCHCEAVALLHNDN